MKSRGSSVDAPTQLERFMRSSPDLTDVHLRELWVPIGPWQKGV